MFKKVSIKQKMLGVVAVLMVTVSGIGFYIDRAVTPISGQWDSYQNEVTSRQQLLQTIKSDFGYGGMIHHFKNYVLRGEAKYLDRINGNYSALTAAIKDYRALGSITPEEQKALTEIQNVTDAYQQQTGKIQALLNQKSSAEIDNVVKINDGPALKAFDVLNSHYRRMTDEYTSRIDGVITNANATLLLGLGIVLAVVLVAVGYLHRIIITPLKQLNETLSGIASGDGDLSIRLEETREDELGQVARGFNRFTEKLQSMIQQQLSIIDAIAQQAGDLKQIANSTNQAMGNQQQDTQQLESQLSTFKSMLEQVAENTENAATASNNVNTRSTEGQKTINRSKDDILQLEIRLQRVSVVLGELNSASDEIAQVVNVIGGIAEQTNLLALNAAIEAARAGESGRGFAVVADEVRGLAQRTAESLEDIRRMTDQLQSGTQNAVSEMGHGQEEVKDSVSLSQLISDDIKLVSEEVGAIFDVNTQIAQAAKQQSVATAEINGRIQNMTQMSASIFEDSRQVAEHSEDLEKLSHDLKKLVGEFKV